MKLLIESGADVSAHDPIYKATPVQWAEFFGRQDAADLLCRLMGHRQSLERGLQDWQTFVVLTGRSLQPTQRFCSAVGSVQASCWLMCGARTRRPI